MRSVLYTNMDGALLKGTDVEIKRSIKPAIKLIRITTVPASLLILLRNQLKFMSRFYNVLAVSSPGRELEDVQFSEGVPTVAVKMSRAITPLQDIRAIYLLYRLFKKEKPAIVHTHTPKAGFVGMIAARLAGVPIRLHTVAGLPLIEKKGLKRKMLEWVEVVTYAGATKVYPNSHKLASFISEKKYCKPAKLKILGNGSSNGIDTDFFKLNAGIAAEATKIKEQLSIGENDFVFVFVGRLVRDKGVEELVEAFNIIRAKDLQVKLLLVGCFEPELDPLNKKTARQIETDTNIIHVGFKKDIRPYLAISHALTFPSYREGFPNVPLQAGCFDLPSIVSDINGCNEIISHGKNGLLVPAKNSHALAEAMKNLYTDKSLYNMLKNNSRQTIVNRYDQKHFWNLLLREYQNHVNEYAAL